MAEFGAAEEDVEDIAAVVGQLAGVHTAVTIRELKPGECKLSVRTAADLDASRVCSLLGGGGHAAAAGAMVEGTMETVRQAVIAAIEQVRGEG